MPNIDWNSAGPRLNYPTHLMTPVRSGTVQDTIMCYFVSQGVAATLLSPGESNCVLGFGPDHKTKKSPSRASVLGHCTNARSSLCSNIIRYNTFLPPASVYCTECKPKTKSGQESLSLECTKYPCSELSCMARPYTWHYAGSMFVQWYTYTMYSYHGGKSAAHLQNPLPCNTVSCDPGQDEQLYPEHSAKKKNYFHHPTDIVRLSYIAT